MIAVGYKQQVHLIGRVSVFIILASFISMPFVLSMVEGIPFDAKLAITNAIPLIVTFSILGAIENITFMPIIGPAALYCAAVTGNVGNMKVPASVNAMEITDCPPGTDKGYVISTIAVAVSSLVTMAIMIVFVFFLAPYFEPIYNNPFFKPAFENMIPALFGAILAPVVIANLKESAVPILLPAVLVFVLGAPVYGKQQSYIMAGIVVLSAMYSLALHRDTLKPLPTPEG